MKKVIGPAVSALLLLAVAVFLAWPSGNDGETSELSTSDSAAVSDDTRASGTEPADAEVPESEQTAPTQTEPEQVFSDLPLISRSELPPEALDTLADISSGGPYDFSKDDSTFQNREGYLPDRDQGHYREYTVITPGSPDRGARRIVAGADGELYYTDDHYNSFREIVG